MGLSWAENWYDGIDSVSVFSPGDDVGSFAWKLYEDTQTGQFSARRYAILLRRGDYGQASIAVGYYTSVAGLGSGPDDVSVGSVYTLDNPDIGNACDNFWRSTEGIATTNPSITWAASQASPMRRMHIGSELWLSEDGAPHWSSGGLLSDSVVDGPLYMGTQQQYLVRNSHLNEGIVGQSMNYVFVGTEGAPESSDDGTVSTVQSTPRSAEKPFLTENDGVWRIAVPKLRTSSSGTQRKDTDVDYIDFSSVYVAEEGDTADEIIAGIEGKKALLLTPGIYGVSRAIDIKTPGFVVLGIGFPTLVATHGNSALHIWGPNVKVAHVLLEAGTPVTQPATQPLLVWDGDHGVGTDIFTRVGAFLYARPFKPSCLKTRADVHMLILGSHITLENLWLWHADHDDCGGGEASDASYSKHALIVRGADCIVYGLKAEHTFSDIVSWQGESGQVYLFQSELPYDDQSFNSAAYRVAHHVNQHKAVGIGAYQIGTYTVDAGFRLPPTADVTNLFVWCITGPEDRFRSVVCTSPSGLDGCYNGDRCDSNSCYVYKLPRTEAEPLIAV